MSELTSSAEARLSELDRTLDAASPTQQLSDDLFAVVDLLDGQPSLRRALTDPGREPQHRTMLVDSLLANKINAAALDVVKAAVRLRWGSARGVAQALERQAVRAQLVVALTQRKLDQVEEELFRFGRVVNADSQLRDALANRVAPVQLRQALVANLLGSKVCEPSLRLASRAVKARERTFELTLDHYLNLAAGIRQRAVAKVTVARPLTPEQRDRLRVALSKQAHRDVDVQEIVDPTVLGGVRVELGDDIVEGTIAAKVEAARRAIS